MMRSVTMLVCMGALAAIQGAAGAEPVAGETLGQVLREHQWDRIIGTWVDAETKGAALRVTYSWRFKDHVIETRTRSKQEETVALMGRNPKTGEVYHVGATSKGGGSLGKWEMEGGDAILSLGVVTGEGQEGGIRVRHRLEDVNTLMATVEGEKPTTIRMVRVGKQAAPVTKKGAQPKRGGKPGAFTEGNTTVYVQPVLQNVDTDGSFSIEEDELAQHYMGVLKQYKQCQGKLLTLFDADKDGVLNAAESQAVREFVFASTGMLLYDRNSDWRIDDDEADSGWENLAETRETYNRGSLKKFDANRDGVLDPQEAQKAREMIRHWQEKQAK